VSRLSHASRLKDMNTFKRFFTQDFSVYMPIFCLYLEQSRTWICKPRYSYAGKGIYVLSGNSDLNAVFKFKLAPGSRLQYEPKFTGYLMQE